MLTKTVNNFFLFRLVEEVDTVLEGDSDVNNDHLPQLTYMTQVIQETLRMYPIGPGTSREVTKDTVIGGTLFPKGSIIMVCSYLYFVEIY